ncbi:hypothetical protein SCODD09_01814 [Streptococcus constellatus]|nr:hypothetical protein SCODD09_01814 [Streptococcus constellatus]
MRSNIKKITTPYLDGREFPEADFIFATAVSTAEIVKSLPLRYGKNVILSKILKLGFYQRIKLLKVIIMVF